MTAIKEIGGINPARHKVSPEYWCNKSEEHCHREKLTDKGIF